VIDQVADVGTPVTAERRERTRAGDALRLHDAGDRDRDEGHRDRDERDGDVTEEGEDSELLQRHGSLPFTGYDTRRGAA
jgi:hypothetical protein